MITSTKAIQELSDLRNSRDYRERCHEALALIKGGMKPELAAGLCNVDAEDLEGRASVLDYVPTPEQIKAAAAEIQAGWTESEERSRTKCSHDWHVPMVAPSSEPIDMQDD